MKKRVTIKSIARDLGISHMTVSRALSDNPNVNEETRKAVLQRARELGYVKSAAARAMRGDSTGIVGLLLPNIVNEFYARFADTLAKACAADGYHVIIHLTNDDAGMERQAVARLREVQAEAVILVPAPGEPVDRGPDLSGMRVIQLIRERPLGHPVASILVDDREAIRNAVVHLARRGHTAIAYIGADTTMSSGRQRLAAFRDGLHAAALAEDADLIFTGAPSTAMGRRIACEILETTAATAIVCGGVEISNGALSAYMERPDRAREVAFMGYGDPSFYAWVNGGISTIRVPVDRLAYQAIELVQAGDDPGAEPAAASQQIAFPAELVIRDR